MDGLSMMQMIGNFGFPIVVTFYLLHRFENRLDRLRASVEELCKNISSIENKHRVDE